MNKTRKKRGSIVRGIFLTAATLVILGMSIVFLFRIREYEVEGNEYYGDTTIITWLGNDRLSENSLYILLKYTFTEPELPSGAESIQISLKNPWTLRIVVEEKDLAGYVDYDDAYLYFDKEGTAAIRTTQQIDGVPYIEGLEYDASGVVLGESLPVEDDRIFDRIVEASRSLSGHGLKPDRMTCEDGSVQVYFGNVRVLLGDGNYDERTAQIEPILESLFEEYPDASGTLHLENYDSSASSVRFVPDEN